MMRQIAVMFLVPCLPFASALGLRYLFSLFLRQLVQHLIDQTTNHSFLIIARKTHFRGNEGEQQLLTCIMIDNWRGQVA